MMNTAKRPLLLTGVCAFLLVAGPGNVEAADWPRWRGPQGDGISTESGLLAVWPEDGLKELWRIPLGAGFSGISVVGDRAYTMFASDEGEFVVAIDVADGSIVWKTQTGELFENGYGDGPRATPTVENGRVYALGAGGGLVALNAATGAKIWGFNVLEKFGAENLEFGLSASPVVLDEKLIVVVGARNDNSLVALDKSTGELLWTSLSDRGGYSTPIAIDVDGMPQLVVLTGEAVVGVSPSDGRELWRHPWITTLDANVATPIYHDGKLFVASGYGTGCALFQLSTSDGKASAEELWANKNMKNYFSTSLLIDGYVYGFNNTIFVCMDFETGEIAWAQRGFNRGSLLAADGKLIILGERSDLALAEISQKEYTEISRTEVTEGKAWTVPTVAGGRLFVRNEEELVCLDLKP